MATRQTYQTPTKTGQYVAWLNGHSMAVGDSVEDVERRALTVYESEDWQRWSTHKPTVLRITKGARQTLVSERELAPLNGERK